MASLPTSQRDQAMLAVCILAVVGAGAYWYFVDSPKRVELAKLAAHVDTLDQLNQKARSQLARGSVARFKQEAESLRANLEVLRTLVPAANEVPALINQVSTAARRVRLELGGIDPEPVIEGDLFDTHRYRVKLTGSYHEIGEVLANIGSLSRIVAPMNLQLTLPSGTVKAVPGKQALAATFQIQTYVVRTAPKGQPPAKQGGGPGAGN
jgi:type IV pilus assembly protein PilO